MTAIYDTFLKELASHLAVHVGYKLLAQPDATVRCKISPEQLPNYFYGVLKNMKRIHPHEVEFIDADIVVTNGEMTFKITRSN